MLRRLGLAAIMVFACLSGVAVAAVLSETGSGTVTTSFTGSTQILRNYTGTVEGSPVSGTFSAGENDLSGACGEANGRATLTDASGDQLFKVENGTGCETDSGHVWSGTYTVSGGTGKFEGASGTGTFSYTNPGDGTFSSTESGSVTLPNAPPDRRGKGCGDKKHTHADSDECKK